MYRFIYVCYNLSRFDHLHDLISDSNTMIRKTVTDIFLPWSSVYLLFSTSLLSTGKNKHTHTMTVLYCITLHGLDEAPFLRGLSAWYSLVSVEHWRAVGPQWCKLQHVSLTYCPICFEIMPPDDTLMFQGFVFSPVSGLKCTFLVCSMIWKIIQKG